MAEAIVASLKAEAEAGQQSDLAATARALREMHSQWQEVAEAPRQSAQRLWDRFRLATDFIRARCESYFQKLREERQVSHEKKTELVVEAEVLASSNDWAKTAGRLQELQAEWQALGPSRAGCRTRARPAVPCGVQQFLLAPPRRPVRPQEGLVRQSRAKGSAL